MISPGHSHAVRRVVVALGLVALVACGKASGPHYKDPYANKAVRLVLDIAGGRYDAARDGFDAAMTAGLSTEMMRTNWGKFQSDFGKYTGYRHPQRVMDGILVVERVFITTSTGRGGEVRVTYHPSGKVAGLSFLRPGLKTI